MNEQINTVLQSYIDNNELAQSVLIVHQDGTPVYKKCFGYADLEKREPVKFDSVFRIMSMTKVVIALCILKLVEEGRLNLDDPLEKYIPEFADQLVAKPGQYEFVPDRPLKMLSYLLTFSMDKVKGEKKERSITIRDLLSHSSGLEQGMIGLLNLQKNKKLRLGSLRDCVNMYSRYLLDFQPGTDTSYSPLAGFNILGYLLTLISNESLESFMQKNICVPLNMKNTSFFLDENGRSKLVKVYKRKKDKLVNVTDTDEDLYGVMRMIPESFEAGSGGLYSTAEDYEHLARMLLNKGMFEGRQVFRKETIELLQKPGAYRYLEKDPGLTWGLGVKIRMDPEKAGSSASKGTYGWSGAFGTHFFVSPHDDLEAVFMTNRSDLDGASSYVSKRIEELVFKYWKKGS